MDMRHKFKVGDTLTHKGENDPSRVVVALREDGYDLDVLQPFKVSGPRDLSAEYVEDMYEAVTVELPGMYTGIRNPHDLVPKRFYVGAESRLDAITKVRKAHSLLHGMDAAMELELVQVERWNNIHWTLS